MDQLTATRPAPGTVNDDTFLTGPRFAAVLDGCTDPGRPSGCEHDVPWLVAHLSGHLAAQLAMAEGTSLPDVLERAIELTREDHPNCDLSNPDSPSSTVTIIRETDEHLDYLVLADSPLLLEHTDGRVTHLVDDQVEHLPSYTFDAVAHWRNRPGGFWVASTDPDAAHHGVTGQLPRDDVRRALLMTDGVSRLVDRYEWAWDHLVTVAAKSGPTALIEAVHTQDSLVGDPTGPWPDPLPGKRFDDATAVLCHIADTN